MVEKYVTLEGDWSETPAQPGHIVHILANFDQEVFRGSVRCKGKL
jgi:hypothetical protein